jgi:transcriptional regulator with XRE-family HTH domain
MDENANLGRAIHEARMTLGMSQSELAEASGLARATVQKAERGGAIRASNIARLEQALAPALHAHGGKLVASAVSERRGRVYGPVTDDDIRRAVTDALVEHTDVSTGEIRVVTAQVVEHLRERGLLPPAPGELI